MLEELRRCNSIGNIVGILFLLSILNGKEKVGKNEILNRCALENNIKINSPGAIAFLEYLKLVDVTSDSVIPLPAFNELVNNDADKIINRIICMSMDTLIEEGIFDNNATRFNLEKGRLIVKKSAFPLTHAAVRNFLIMVNAFGREDGEDICITGNYEDDLTRKLGERREKVTLEQLLKRQEEQNQRGLEAEEFVLKIEKARLPAMAHKIKRISDFDVTAGYDIVSYENNDAEHYDRFIEVKSYIGKPHFYWSKNEMYVAELKADNYLLCLVDYSQIKETGYQPEYIRNPYKTIFTGSEWLMEPASYKVQKI